MKNTIIIITGGTCKEKVLSDFLKSHTIDKCIAVDGGLRIADQLQVPVDYIVGDFDTIEASILDKYKEKSILKEHGTKIIEFQPEKDDTDSEIAIRLALTLEPKEIIIFGGTGTRLDHTMANIHLLKLALDKNIKATIIDSCNKIYLINQACHLEKSKVSGNYISLLPLTTTVTGITLKGFKYPLYQKTIEIGTSLCISNEIVEDIATIEFDKGILIVYETADE